MLKSLCNITMASVVDSEAVLLKRTVLITFRITDQLRLTFTTLSSHFVTMGDAYQPQLNGPWAAAGRLFANPANVRCTRHFGITISKPILNECYKVTKWSERAVKWPISHFNHTFHDNPNNWGFTFALLLRGIKTNKPSPLNQHFVN